MYRDNNQYMDFWGSYPAREQRAQERRQNRIGLAIIIAGGIAGYGLLAALILLVRIVLP